MSVKDSVERIKKNKLQTGKKYLQNTYSTKYQYLEYLNKSQKDNSKANYPVRKKRAYVNRQFTEEGIQMENKHTKDV